MSTISPMINAHKLWFQSVFDVHHLPGDRWSRLMRQKMLCLAWDGWQTYVVAETSARGSMMHPCLLEGWAVSLLVRFHYSHIIDYIHSLFCLYQWFRWTKCTCPIPVNCFNPHTWQVMIPLCYGQWWDPWFMTADVPTRSYASSLYNRQVIPRTL